jgi:hypothetical protein
MIDIASDLRPRVLAALHTGEGPGVLSTALTRIEIGAAAGAAGSELVVYLLGGHAGTPGQLLTVRADGAYPESVVLGSPSPTTAPAPRRRSWTLWTKIQRGCTWPATP